MSGKVIGIALFGLMLAFCAGSGDKADTKRKKISAEYNLSAQETKAYRACSGQMFGKKFTPKKGITMWPVPEEVCVCHARKMVTVFKEGKYSSNRNVINLIADEKARPVPLKASDLYYPEKADQQFLDLAQSVVTCAVDYAEEHNAKQAELLEAHIIKNPSTCNGTSNTSIKDTCSKLKRQGRI